METFKTKYEQFNAFVIRHIGGFTVVIFLLLLGGVINGTDAQAFLVSSRLNGLY